MLTLVHQQPIQHEWTALKQPGLMQSTKSQWVYKINTRHGSLGHILHDSGDLILSNFYLTHPNRTANTTQNSHGDSQS